MFHFKDHIYSFMENHVCKVSRCQKVIVSRAHQPLDSPHTRGVPRHSRSYDERGHDVTRSL